MSACLLLLTSSDYSLKRQTDEEIEGVRSAEALLRFQTRGMIILLRGPCGLRRQQEARQRRLCVGSLFDDVQHVLYSPGAPFM